MSVRVIVNAFIREAIYHFLLLVVVTTYASCTVSEMLLHIFQNLKRSRDP